MNLEGFLQNVIDGEERSFIADKKLNKKTIQDVWADILHDDQSTGQKSILGETRLYVNQPQCLVEDDSMFKPLAAADFHSRDQQYFETPFPIPPPSSAVVDSQSVPGRKRGFCGEATETTTERRKKRMIKNRESAARSRARKQAYTNQLEHEVFRLREINCWLKKEEEVDKLLFSDTPLKFQLRRTCSTIF